MERGEIQIQGLSDQNHCQQRHALFYGAFHSNRSPFHQYSFKDQNGNKRRIFVSLSSESSGEYLRIFEHELGSDEVKFITQVCLVHELEQNHKNNCFN